VVNVLDCLPKSAQLAARKALAEIRDAEDREHAEKAVTGFAAAYGAKYPKAVAKITDDQEQLLAFTPPPRFARPIVQGKSYDLADPSVATYFAELLQRILGAVVELDFSQPWHRPGPVFGDPRLAPYRLGQRSFQAVVLDAYHRRCAISGTHIPPVLQAAHIRPVTKGASTASTTGCYCDQISTPCSTAATSASIPTIACA